jgi:undecaprenyl-diphosphatase
MDLRLFRLINDLSGRYSLMDRLMILISNRIRYAYILILVIMLFKNRSNRRIAAETGSSVLLSFIAHFFIKLFYYKPRPFKKRRVGILIPSKLDSTFPSKHTQIAFAASTSIFFFHRSIGSLMLWMSAVTGFSRIWVGHHYPSDILGSAMLGSLASVATRLFSFKQFGNKPDPE